MRKLPLAAALMLAAVTASAEPVKCTWKVEPGLGGAPPSVAAECPAPVGGLVATVRELPAGSEASIGPAAPAAKLAFTLPTPSDKDRAYEIVVRGESADSQAIKDIIVAQMGVDPARVVDSAKVMADLGADSLDVVEIVMALEEKLGVQIPDEDIEKLCTVGDVVSYVAAKRPAPESAEPLFRWTTLIRPEGKPMMEYQGRPTELAPPADFDAYWARAKAELAAVPMTPKVIELADKGSKTARLFRVELPTVGNTTIVAWYTVPRSAFGPDGKAIAKCPAMIVMPGYGAEEPALDRTADGIATISVNPRHHGPSKEFWTSPVEHLLYNIDQPEQYYYKLAVLDGLRGAEFLFSRPEIDPARVASEGGSQGGYFAIALAAFEPRLACAVANIPAFSDIPDAMILSQTGWGNQYRDALAEADKTDPAKAARMRQSLAYTDGANLATRAQCPVQINSGGQDPVCHYMTGVVILNRIPAGVEKEYHIYPDAKHEAPGTMRANNAAWVKRWLKFDKAPSFPGNVLPTK